MKIVWWVIALWAPALMGQTPTITDVTNAADFTLSVAPGSLAALFGSNLSSATESAGSIPLLPVLNNVEVFVNGQQAPLLYVSATQINFQVPYEASPGTATLSVTSGDVVSNSLTFTIATVAPGIFQYGLQHAPSI